MVPEIEKYRTYNFWTRVILAWMRIIERKNLVQQFFMKNPLQLLFLEKTWILKDFLYTRSPISLPRFWWYLRTDSTLATQNLNIGVILDAESDGNNFFLNFTILRNKLGVLPMGTITKLTFRWMDMVKYLHIHTETWMREYIEKS